MPRAIQELTDLLSELPGVGPRQARRIAQFLLRSDSIFKKKLATAIESVSGKVAQCRACLRYDEVTETGICNLCGEDRDPKTLLVVEKDVDVEGIEAAGMYRGRYFVLGALMPLSGKRRGGIAPRTSDLINRITDRLTQGLTEVVLAFATTPEGDYTARELKRSLIETFPTLTISFLGRGLSLGAEIEYADQETLRSAFQGRSEKL